MMYNHGKGEFITRTEYLRWKFRDNVKVRKINCFEIIFPGIGREFAEFVAKLNVGVFSVEQKMFFFGHNRCLINYSLVC